MALADTEAGIFRAQAENGEEMEGSLDGLRPDPDDPATAGCLLALLGVGAVVRVDAEVTTVRVPVRGGFVIGTGSTIGRACIDVAEALERWPDGGEP